MFFLSSTLTMLDLCGNMCEELRKVWKNMLSNERHEHICNLIRKKGAVTTSELVKKFGVSLETIRRDLLLLEKQQCLQRVHGGAVKVGGMMHFHDLPQRMEENDDKKRELSHAAMEFIDDGDIIVVDAGSTAVAFAEVLKEKKNEVTVITHSLDVFEILSGYKNFNVILCGGQYLGRERAFCGELTLDMMRKIHARKAFLFVTAVSLKHGICDFQMDLYPVQKLMLDMADEVFVLADSTKFEKKALLKIDDMNPGYTYITDGELGEDMYKLYEENHIRVICGGGKSL